MCYETFGRVPVHLLIAQRGYAPPGKIPIFCQLFPPLLVLYTSVIPLAALCSTSPVSEGRMSMLPASFIVILIDVCTHFPLIKVSREIFSGLPIAPPSLARTCVLSTTCQALQGNVPPAICHELPLSWVLYR